MKKFLKDNYPILIVLCISLILHIFALVELGINYNILSDDLSYVQSGVTFAFEHKITMHGVLSAQIMPGMPIFIGVFALIFGNGLYFMLSLKIFWILMGIMTIFISYKILRLFTNKFIAAIPCLFFLSPEYIWMNNLTLTETPYIFLAILTLYYTFKYVSCKNNKYYILMTIFYTISIFIRPVLLIYPLFVLIYLLLKKYSFEESLKKVLIMVIPLIVLLVPWTYRNYKVFHKFIPLTYGAGNLILMGTYQGYDYPDDNTIDYSASYESLPKEMRYYLENPNEKDYMTKYYSLKYDEIKASIRQGIWWQNNKISMIKTYLIYKPYKTIYNIFYWQEILGIKTFLVRIFRQIEIVLFGLSIIFILINKTRKKELLFIFLLYFSQIVTYAYGYAFERYAFSTFFLRYIVIGIGLDILYNWLKQNNYRKVEND